MRWRRRRKGGVMRQEVVSLTDFQGALLQCYTAPSPHPQTGRGSEAAEPSTEHSWTQTAHQNTWKNMHEVVVTVMTILIGSIPTHFTHLLYQRFCSSVMTWLVMKSWTPCSSLTRWKLSCQGRGARTILHHTARREDMNSTATCML